MQKSKQHRTHTESGTRRFPLYEKYINWTPYQYAMNNPVSFVDVNGKEISIQYIQDGKMKEYKYIYGQVHDVKNYPDFVRKTVQSLD